MTEDRNGKKEELIITILDQERLVISMTDGGGESIMTLEKE